jgi:hypothetical protein
MALAFDAVGPSSAGAISSGATTLTFAHTITGSSTVLIAGIAVDPSGSDAALTCACTYGGVSMTSLDKWHSGGATQSAGYLQVFGIIAAAQTANVVATVSGGTPANIEGGSISFTGAAQTVGAAFGTPAHADSNSASVTTSTCAMASNTSGNIIAGFTTSGTGITSATSPSTSRFIKSNTGTGAAGSCAGATSPSTGSSVTMAWTQLSDFYAEILVEVLVTAGPSVSPNAGVATAAGVSPGAATIPYSLTTAVAHASAVAILPGGYGTWGTPEFAEGGP